MSSRGRSLRLVLAEARRGAAARRRRALLAGVGIALAAAMLSAAIVVADGLGLGFPRAVRAADLPNVIVRFNPEPLSEVARRIRALPDVARYATRTEINDLSVAARGHSAGGATAEVVGAGRAGGVGGAESRGYAVVAGHDLSRTGSEVLVEKAWADSWGLVPGDTLEIGGLGPERIAGLAEAPDNVGYPLAAPRFYLARTALQARFGARALSSRVNYAEIWVRNPRYLNDLLVQARATSFGLRDIRFATRASVRVLVHQAAGIVIDLLVALSLIALVTAGAMLAASARAEVQRRLQTIGVQRAIGASAGHVTGIHALEAALIAVPAAALGCAAGTLVISGPADRLLELLNEPAPGSALLAPVVAGWLVAVMVAVAGAAWPAWRANARPVVSLLRGADVGGRGGRPMPRWRARVRRHLARGRRGSAPAGLVVLGGRLVAARRARLLATVVTLGLSAAFVLLLLSLASELNALQTDPGALGRRYQLTAGLSPRDAGAVSRIPGVQAVAARYQLQAADSFSLGETIDTIAYSSDPTTFEAPPLVTGNRPRGGHETDIGEGLAEALGVGVGQTLALQLPSGQELRLRVAGVVSSLQEQGRVAYVPAAALLRADPAAPSTLAVRLRPGADVIRVTRALHALGAAAQGAAGATSKSAALVAVLRAIIRAVAVVDGLVCLYALVQACTLTVQERRRTVAVLRACGAGAGAVRRLLAGAVLCMLLPATVVGVLLERLALGPSLSRLAANYVTLPLRAGPSEIAVTIAGLLLAAAVAVLWVARQTGREPIVSGLGA
jgi:predicted lysophospholipase L1 biosynthesis ABC-type transport system permease subunit